MEGFEGGVVGVNEGCGGEVRVAVSPDRWSGG